MTPDVPKRGRGRPAIGTRIHVHVPDEMLAGIDAVLVGAETRASFLREAAALLLAKRRRDRPGQGARTDLKTSQPTDTEETQP